MKTQGFLRTLSSVMSALIGVQSKKRREADFATGNIYRYAVVGTIMTLTFVVIIASIARYNASENQHLESVGTHIVKVEYN